MHSEPRRGFVLELAPVAQARSLSFPSLSLSLSLHEMDLAQPRPLLFQRTACWGWVIQFMQKQLLTYLQPWTMQVVDPDSPPPWWSRFLLASTSPERGIPGTSPCLFKRSNHCFYLARSLLWPSRRFEEPGSRTLVFTYSPPHTHTHQQIN